MEISAMRTQIDTFTSENKNYLDLNAKHKTEVEALTKQILAQKTQIEEFSKNNSTLAAENKTFAVNNENLVAATTQAKETLGTLLKTIKKSGTDTQQLMDSVKLAQQNIDAAMRKNTEIQRLVAGKLDSQTSKLADQLARLQNMNTIQAENLKLARELARLQNMNTIQAESLK